MKKKLVLLAIGLSLLTGCQKQDNYNNTKNYDETNDIAESTIENCNEDNNIKEDNSIEDNSIEDTTEWSLNDFKGYTADNCSYNFDEIMNCTGMNCTEYSDKYHLNIEQHSPDNGIELSNEDGLSIYMYTYSSDYKSSYLKDNWENIKISGIIPTWHDIYIGSTINDELTNQWKGKTFEEYYETWNNEEQGYKLSFLEYHQNIYSAFVIADKYVGFNNEKQYIIHVKPIIPGDKLIKSATQLQDEQLKYFYTAEITAIYETPCDIDKIAWYQSIPDFNNMIGKTIDEFQAENPNYTYNSGSYTDLDGMNSFMFYPYNDRIESCKFYAWYDENKVIQKITKD